jgi:hypothetical protein
MLQRELALLDGQTAAFLSVVDDLRGGIILVLQARLIAVSAIGVVDLGAVDLLEGLHRG